MHRSISPDVASPPSLSDPALYINRELSWLAFNERVLDQAEGTDHPLLERVRFLSIVGTNLDEFYMIRVAALLRKVRTGVEDLSQDGLATSTQLALVQTRGEALLDRASRCWAQTLRPSLEAQGIHFLERSEFTPEITSHLSAYFEREISPVLTPLAFDPGHPFPFISNLSKNFAVVVKHGGRKKFARVKLPDVLPRFVPLPAALSPREGVTFVYLEDVVRGNLPLLFPGTVVAGAHLFRVVRDADLVIQEDEADDLLETIDQGLKQRRHGALSMLEVDSTMPQGILNILVENFEIENERVFRSTVPARPRRLDAADAAPASGPEVSTARAIDDVARRRGRFDLRGAAAPGSARPSPISIVQRRRDIPPDGGPQSARHRDQDDALSHRRRLPAGRPAGRRGRSGQAGRRARRAQGPLRRAQQHRVGATARSGRRPCRLRSRQPQDPRQALPHRSLGRRRHPPLCARRHRQLQPRHRPRLHGPRSVHRGRPSIVEDVTDVFNYLTGYSHRREYRELLVAPGSLRPGVIALIDREAAHASAGKPAHIIIKVNALTDQEVIRALYRASSAGVQVDLIVRGVCCLRPGVPGVSDRISVRSIVGRFLEHSRIFWFGNDGEPRPISAAPT